MKKTQQIRTREKEKETRKSENNIRQSQLRLTSQKALLRCQATESTRSLGTEQLNKTFERKKTTKHYPHSCLYLSITSLT